MAVLRIRDQKISRLFFKELTKEQREKVYNIKQGPNAGKSMAMFKDKTHRINMQMEDGTWYDVGYTTIKDDKPVQWRKELDGDWITINEGAIVCFKANENNWTDKATGDLVKGNAKVVSDSFDLIENGSEDKNPFIYNQSGDAQQGDRNTDSSGKKQYTKRDYSGVEIGHAINGGLLRAKHSLKDITKVLELSKNVHDITIQLKAEYKEKYPKMSDYDLGAMVGHAILNSCRIGGSEHIIKKNAVIIIEEIVPAISAYVRGEKEEEEVSEEIDEEIVDKEEVDDDIELDDLPF